MASNIKGLDPVQGLVDYVNDIKPYHTKVIESLVEYVSQELVDVTLLENYLLDIEMEYLYDINKLGCSDGGFGSLPYDDPDVIAILSPDPSKTVPEFPAITSNSFIVLGDQRALFTPSSNLTFKITSFIEDRIIDVTASSGSPVTGGLFTVLGDKTAQYSVNDIFTVSGSLYNDTGYKITAVTPNVGSPIPSTTLEVDGQIVNSDDVSGFIKTVDVNNNGSVLIVSSVFTKGTNSVRAYTTVFITGMVLVPPVVANITENQRYVSLISIVAIEYKKILSYSNALRYYNSTSPATLLQTPNEGVAYATIVGLSQGSPTYFVVEGNYENSNIFVGDEISVVKSTDNNTTYIIKSIAHGVLGSPEYPITTFGVGSIHDSSVDGFVKLKIPSNVFIVDGNYISFFKQGVRIKVITGSKVGNYTTLYSTFTNNETHIRVHEDIIGHVRGRLIIGNGASACGSPLLNGFIVEGNVQTIFKQGTQFNVTSSIRNDGSYTATDSIYCSSTNSTTIAVAEAYDDTDTTGELHEFVKGVLTYLSPGFGQTPELCEVVPETLIKIGIKDRLYIDNIGVWASDDIIAHGIEDSHAGFDLPPSTIFTSGSEPTVTVSDTAPISPVEDTMWFDTSPNDDVLSAPGILKQYSFLLTGSPSEGWVEIPRNTAHWVDTDTGYMYYRMIYQYYDNSVPEYPSPTIGNNLDTGWVLEYTKIPGYNDLLTGNSSRERIGIETFFATESSIFVAETVFNLTTLTIPLVGSPILPNPLMLEVYVNSAPASVNILSTTSFEILSPRLRIDDFIEARVFDSTADPSNTFIGAFDTNAAIAETFDMLKGYKFHIDGTESIGSPLVNRIYIPDTASGDVFNIFKPQTGSPPTLADTVIEITNSIGSPNNDGIYTILDATQYGSPNSHVILTVAEILLNTGIFGGSPLTESGKALYQQWFQYLIVGTTANTIVVLGDATGDITGGSPSDSIRISHSTNAGGSPIFGSPEINNDGIYTVSVTPTYDGRNTTITTIETIPNTGNTGGWVESL